jgi:hypothetical protein
MLIWIRAALLGLCLALLGSQCFGAPERKKPAAKPKAAHPPHSVAQRPARLPAPLLQDGVAELRLIEIYRLIGQSETRAALNLAESLVREFPDFALAQLVYGDLLTARTQAIEQFGNAQQARHRGGCLALAPVSVSKTGPGLTLVADYYISVGKLGIEKSRGRSAHAAGGVLHHQQPGPKVPERLLWQVPCRSTTPMCWTPSAARPAAASGCTARRPTSFRARRWHRRLCGAGQPGSGPDHCANCRDPHHARGHSQQLQWVTPQRTLHGKQFEALLSAGNAPNPAASMDKLAAFLRLISTATAKRSANGPCPAQ